MKNIRSCKQTQGSRPILFGVFVLKNNTLRTYSNHMSVIHLTEHMNFRWLNMDFSHLEHKLTCCIHRSHVNRMRCFYEVEFFSFHKISVGWGGLQNITRTSIDNRLRVKIEILVKYLFNFCAYTSIILRFKDVYFHMYNYANYRPCFWVSKNKIPHWKIQGWRVCH